MRLSTIVAGLALGVTAFAAAPPGDNSIRVPADGVEIRAETAVDKCDRCVIAIVDYCGKSPSLRCNAKVCHDLANLCKGCGVCRSNKPLSDPALEVEDAALKLDTVPPRSPANVESLPELEGNNPQDGGTGSLLCDKCRSHRRFACTLSCLGCGDCHKPNEGLVERSSQDTVPQGICDTCRKFRYLCRTLVCRSCRPCNKNTTEPNGIIAPELRGLEVDSHDQYEEHPTQLQDRTPQETHEPEPCSYCDISIAYCKQFEKTPGSCENDLCPVYRLCENCPVCDITKTEDKSPIFVKAQDVTRPRGCQQCEGLVYHCRKIENPQDRQHCFQKACKENNVTCKDCPACKNIVLNDTDNIRSYYRLAKECAKAISTEDGINRC